MTSLSSTGLTTLNARIQQEVENGHVTAAQVAIARDGKTAISASLDNTLKIWDLFTGEEIASFSGDSGFNCCAILADGVTVVAGDRSGRVHFLRLEGVKQLTVDS